MMFVQLYMNMQNMWILHHLNMYKWELGEIPVDIFVIFYTFIYMILHVRIHAYLSIECYTS